MTSLNHSLEDQLQHERLARAQAALQRGEMQVTVLSDCAWIVASENRQVGKVSRYTVACEDAAWSCTCPDFADRCRRFGLRCKHIEAVRLTETIGTGTVPEGRNTHLPFTNHPTEENMNQTMPSLDPHKRDPATDQILGRLRQPLDMNRVKRRQAPGLGTVPYLEGFDVIEVANDLFQFQWSFDLLSEPQIMRWDRVMTHYDQRARKKVPLLGEDGSPVTEVAGIVYLTGKVVIVLDWQVCTHADAGRCVFTGDTPEALDMAIAGAVTDCLKRCFRQLGEQFGNSLYDKEIAKTAGLEISSGPSEKATSPQPPAAAVKILSYLDNAAVEPGNTAEVEAFHAFLSNHQGQAPASREALRTWVASRNGKK